MKKKNHFDIQRLSVIEAGQKEVAAACDLLDDCARVRTLANVAAFESYSEMKEKCMISSSVSDSYLRNNAYHKGFLLQANHFIQQGINYQQFEEFETAISALEQEKGGSTMISNGANLSSLSRKAKQRARNTGPNGLNLDMLASNCTGLSGSCDNCSARGGNRGGGGGELTVVPGSKGQLEKNLIPANWPFEQMLTRTRAKATKRMSDMNLDCRYRFS
jgi:hypothetical protein